MKFLAALLLLLSAAPAFARSPVTILYTSNNRGEIQFCGCAEGHLGSLSRRSTYISEVRAGSDPVFLFDTGDAFFPVSNLPKHLESSLLSKGAIIARVYELLGYDGISEGELDRLLSTDKYQRMPWIAGEKVIERGGWKLGLVGFMSPVFSKHPEEAEWRQLQVNLNRLKGKADLIVVLAHMTEQDIETTAPFLKGADIVLLGHPGKALRDPIAKAGVLFFEADSRGQYVGRLRIQKKDGAISPKNQEGRFRLEQDFDLAEGEEKGRIKAKLKNFGRLPESWYSHELVPLTERMTPDPRVEELLKGLD